MSTLVHRIDRVEAGSPALLSRLRRHPSIKEVVERSCGIGLCFWQGDWKREVKVGSAACEHAGLLELLDNNPLVCTDTFSVPDPVSTLLLVALGPLIEAGILVEAPVALTNAAVHSDLCEAFLRKAHWTEGVILEHEDLSDLGAFAVNVFAKVRTPKDLADLDGLYEERFGRSFYIRRAEEGDWDVRLTKDQPYALYRLRITPGEQESLLTIQTMADPHGKCGAAQVIHAMNVMAGLEESLGIG